MLCPNCQQDTLLEGKERRVCINCGYSQPISEMVVRVKSSRSSNSLAPASVIPSAPPIAAHSVLSVASALPEPAIEKQLSKVVGRKKAELAVKEVESAKTAANDFASTYKAELKELLGGELGWVFKVIGGLLGLFLIGLLVLTFWR